MFCSVFPARKFIEKHKRERARERLNSVTSKRTTRRHNRNQNRNSLCCPVQSRTTKEEEEDGGDDNEGDKIEWRKSNREHLAF